MENDGADHIAKAISSHQFFESDFETIPHEQSIKTNMIWRLLIIAVEPKRYK